MTCDASTYVKGYSIFSKGIPLCGKPAVAVFRGVRDIDGKKCEFYRCADHEKETGETLERNYRGLWSWEREAL